MNRFDAGSYRVSRITGLARCLLVVRAVMLAVDYGIAHNADTKLYAITAHDWHEFS